jgi:tight adherence protein B
VSHIEWLGASATALLPLGVVALGRAVARDPFARARLAHHISTLERNLCYLQARLGARTLLRYQATAAGVSLALALICRSMWPTFLATVALIAPRIFVQRLCEDRTTRIEQQLDGMLLALANALEASPSLGEAIASAAALMPPPMGEELSLALKRHRLGSPLDRCLTELAERVRSAVVSTAIATIRIARNAGGNLGETLESCAASLREMARLEGVVRTKTAEGRAQSLLIAAVPGPLVWMLHTLDPHLFDPLWETARGHVVVAIAIALWITALLSARKILAVDI